jgi:hypothetical protein
VTACRSIVSAAIFAASLAPSVAHGQQQQQPRTLRIADRIARNHFENGNEYFRLGRYSDAAREFEHAFEISHQNELLYNVGWSYELAGDLPNALEWYQRFESAGAPGFGLEPLHQRMENLRNRMPSSEAPSAAPSGSPSSAPEQNGEGARMAPVRPPPPVREPRFTYRRSTLDTVGPFVAIGVGAVFGGLAVWQGVSYAGDASALGDVNSGAQPWSQDLDARYGRIAREGTLAWTFGGIGVAAVAAGIVWIAARGPGERVELRSARRARPSPFVLPTAGGVVAGVGGVF